MMIDFESVKPVLQPFAPDWGACAFAPFKDYLLDCRAKSRIPQNAATVLTAVFPYRLPEELYAGACISKYAVVPDYHPIAGKRLQDACLALKACFPQEEFVPFTDNSPLPEARCAVESTLGVLGDNGLLIHKDYGSFVFLGEIVTTLAVATQTPAKRDCLHCGICKKCCPTGALTATGVNPSRCLSALTQKKGDLTAEEQEIILQNGSAWGCDICQNSCPLNRHTVVDPLPEFAADARPVIRAGCDIAGRAYEWRGKKVIERNLLLLEQKQCSEEREKR